MYITKGQVPFNMPIPHKTIQSGSRIPGRGVKHILPNFSKTENCGNGIMHVLDASLPPPQWRIQDLPDGDANLLFGHFFSKLHENEFLAERGACVSSSLWTTAAAGGCGSGEVRLMAYSHCRVQGTEPAQY